MSRGNKTEGNRTRWKESFPKCDSVSLPQRILIRHLVLFIVVGGVRGGGGGGWQGGGSHCQIRLINVELN